MTSESLLSDERLKEVPGGRLYKTKIMTKQGRAREKFHSHVFRCVGLHWDLRKAQG